MKYAKKANEYGELSAKFLIESIKEKMEEAKKDDKKNNKDKNGKKK